MSAAQRADVAALKAAVPLIELVRPVVQRLRAAGPGSWMACCPFHDEKSPSLHISRDLYHCFGCGASGDAVSFVMALEGLDFRSALRRLGAPEVTTGVARRRAAARVHEAEADAAAHRLSGAERARAIWREGEPAAGTPVEAYLRSRGILMAELGAMPKSLRFHPHLWCVEAGRHLPAMLAAMVDADGTVVGLHRTFLAPGGQGKARGLAAAKLMLGPCFGAAVRLFDPGAEGRPADVIAVGEGIETTLSFLLLCQRAGLALGGWAAGSLGALVGAGLGGHRLAPGKLGRRLPSCRPDPARPGLLLPAGVGLLYQLVDMDGDRESAEALIARGRAKWNAAGIRVKNARPADGRDWNDELIARGET